MPAPTTLPTNIDVLTTGHIAHSIVVHGAINRLTQVPSSVATAAYTFDLDDCGEVIEVNASTPITVTVPPASSVGFPLGTVISVLQYGTGQVTVAGGTGVTLRTASSLTTRARYSEVSLRLRATNEWVVTGDLS